jgi:uridylate kinase
MNIRDDDGSATGSASGNGIDPYATLNRRRRGVRVTYAAAVALGLVVGGGAIAGAATGSTTSTTQPADHTETPGEHSGPSPQ